MFFIRLYKESQMLRSDERNLLRKIYINTEIIIRRERMVMADLTALNAAVDSLVSEEASVVAALDDLKAKLDAGGTISQADLDALTAKVQQVGSDLQSAVDRDDPPV